MLEIEKIIEGLQDKNLKEVTRRTGLSYLTVWRISNGNPGNVGYETAKKLSDYLENKLGE